ncbi:hypothetical protein CGC21_17200 [Leishmania donovani]|uniref:Uncharacterized protein n=1 Tax=Leishmania donovani TaxID=5661 RepID=A0A504XYQ0_LEIDO|nr:hypothetical protein CGC21_17200 [Leishmania donovani]
MCRKSDYSEAACLLAVSDDHGASSTDATGKIACLSGVVEPNESCNDPLAATPASGMPTKETCEQGLKVTAPPAGNNEDDAASTSTECRATRPMRYGVRKSIPLPAAAATGAPVNEAETSADSQLRLSQQSSPNPYSAVDAKAGAPAYSSLGFYRDAPILHGAAPHLSSSPEEDADKGQSWDFKAVKRNLRVGHTGTIAWLDDVLGMPMKGCRDSSVLQLMESGQCRVHHHVLSRTIPNGITHVYAAPSPAMEVAPSGSTFSWQKMRNIMVTAAIAENVMTKTLPQNLPSTAVAGVVVTTSTSSLAASAMPLNDKHVLVPGISVSPEEVAAKVNGASFPQTDASVSSVGSQPPLEDANELLRNYAQPMTALYNSVSAPGTEEIYFIENVTYKVRILFSGPSARWSISLSKSRDNVSVTIVQAIEVFSNSRRMICTPTVDSMRVMEKDPELKQIGDGHGGLIVDITVNCGGTNFMIGRFLDSSEYASTLDFLNTTNITAAFQSSSRSSSRVDVYTTMVRGGENTFICDRVCKGMIAMGCLIVGLCAVCVAITLVAICCPCYCVRADWGNSTDNSTTFDYPDCSNADAESSRLDMLQEGMHVYGDQNASHYFATVPKRTMSFSKPNA